MDNKTLEKIVRWGIYAVALIPLVIFKEFFSPFHFGKVVVFRALIEILAIFYVALVLQDRSFLPRPTKIFWAITIFAGVFGLTSLTGIYPYQSIFGTLERMGGWFSFLHFWAFFIMSTGVLRTKEHWLTFIKISVFASLLSVIYGFLQKTSIPWVLGATDRERIFGTIGNTALFAGYIIVNAFFALFLAFWKKTRIRYVYIGIAALDFIAIFMTVVRGSLLGVVIAMTIFSLLYIFGKSGRKMIGYGMLGLISLIIVVELILIANRAGPLVQGHNYLKRLTDISLTTRTVQTRLWAWQAGIDGWNDSAKTIILGWGPENFNIPFSKHFNPKFYSGTGSETLFDRAHNMFVEVLVTMGILGEVSYLWIFVVLFLALWKIYRSPDHDSRIMGIVLIAGFIAYIIHNTFIFDTSANFVVFFIFAGFVHFSSLPSEFQSKKQQAKTASSSSLRYSVTIILVVAAAISIYKTDYIPARANYNATRAVVASWNQDNETAVGLFQKAILYDSFLSYELRHRYMLYLLENINKIADIKTLNAGEIMFSAIEEVKKNLDSPMDYLPYLYVSRGYIILGKDNPDAPFNDLALEYSSKALEISPTFIRTYYEIAQAYLNKEDYPDAITMFKKAIDLNPDVTISWWYMGITQLESGDLQEGYTTVQEAFARGYTLSEVDTIRLIDPYIKLGLKAEVVSLFGSLVQMQPDNADYHSRLAAVYAESGRIDDAVREAKISVQLDPSFEPRAREFVKRIGGTW